MLVLAVPPVISTGVIYFSVRVRFSPAEMVSEGNWLSWVIVNRAFLPQFDTAASEADQSDADQREREARAARVKGIWDSALGPVAKIKFLGGGGWRLG